MAGDPMRTAADDIVSYCIDEANRHHGYDAIATAVDHDLANAYSRIAAEVERLAATGLLAAPAAQSDESAAAFPVRPDDHEIPGAWATPGLSGDTLHARARVTAMINRFTDVSDLMVSVADLRALVASPAAPADDEAATVRMAAAMARKAGLEGPFHWQDEKCKCECTRYYEFAISALAALREGKQQ